MKKKPLQESEIRDRIDSRVTHVIAWTTLMDAMAQKTPETLEVPNAVMGEIARSIKSAVTEIQHLVDQLTACHKAEKQT